MAKNLPEITVDIPPRVSKEQWEALQILEKRLAELKLNHEQRMERVRQFIANRDKK